MWGVPPKPSPDSQENQPKAESQSQQPLWPPGPLLDSSWPKLGRVYRGLVSGIGEAESKAIGGV